MYKTRAITESPTANFTASGGVAPLLCGGLEAFDGAPDPLPPHCCTGRISTRIAVRHDLALLPAGSEDVGRRLRKGHLPRHVTATTMGPAHERRQHGGVPPVERV